MPPEPASKDYVDEKIHSVEKVLSKDMVEWRGTLGQQLHDLATDTRTRLARGETERDQFYRDARFSWTEMGRKLDRAISLAEQTNGRVNKHEEELYGVDGVGGIKSHTRSLLDARLYVTVLAGFISTLVVILWATYGSEVKARGILNRTEEEEMRLIEKEIWKHKSATPATTPAPNGP